MRSLQNSSQGEVRAGDAVDTLGGTVGCEHLLKTTYNLQLVLHGDMFDGFTEDRRSDSPQWARAALQHKLVQAESGAGKAL